jgi:ABC-2 type transport system permease protein
MNKIFLIIKREYLTRVRKKTFIVMTILGPVIFALFLFLPTWLATMEDKEVKTIAVIDSSYIFNGILPETEFIQFSYPENTGLEDLRQNFSHTGYSAILYIPENILASNTSILYSDKQPSLSTRMHISNAMEQELEKQKLGAHNIENLSEILASVETNINLRNIIWGDEGREKESVAEISMIIGYAGGMLIYFFIFLFGAQVMRGVIEEKTSRIIEVIVSSVKPFQLMMGKIVGIGLVGLTQFLLWVLLTFAFITIAQQVLMPELSASPTEQIISQDIISSRSIQTGDESDDFMKGLYTSLQSVHFVYIWPCSCFTFWQAICYMLLSLPLLVRLLITRQTHSNLCFRLPYP